MDAKLIKQFGTFLKNGCKRSQFYKAMYLELSLHHDFIAHFDINGFYAARFADPIGLAETIHIVLNRTATSPMQIAVQMLFQEYAASLTAQALKGRKAQLRNIIDDAQAALDALP